jgi:hypothetical protein
MDHLWVFLGRLCSGGGGGGWGLLLECTDTVRITAVQPKSWNIVSLQIQ